jgi:DNA-binding response OmpR family regulator
MTHILLIEPDRVLARTYQQAFEAVGNSVSWAAQAQTALDAADTKMPDIVILELQLVGHSGIEFLYEFRSYPEWQMVPVIIHSMVPPTAFTDMTVLKNELGAEEYYYKPSTKIVQLLSSIREHTAVA